MRHLPLRIATLFFPHFFFFLMHCRMVLIIYYLEELKRVFTNKSTPRDVYRDEGMYLSKIQVPKSLWSLLEQHSRAKRVRLGK